jgi:phosphoadenosine phosphosulfate reductase
MAAALTEQDIDELAAISAAFETAHPLDIVRWAAERFGDGLVATVSLKDGLIPHLMSKGAPLSDVVMIDTQYLFAQTHWYANELIKRFNVALRVEAPLPHVVPDNLWQSDTTACCNVRKVEPLERILATKTAWISGLRRADGPTRIDTPIIGWDAKRGVVKISPLATYTDEEVALYSVVNELPANPLTELGYPSIGCWPCTRPVAEGEDKRAGRWAGEAKTECGIHT